MSNRYFNIRDFDCVLFCCSVKKDVCQVDVHFGKIGLTCLLTFIFLKKW